MTQTSTRPQPLRLSLAPLALAVVLAFHLPPPAMAQPAIDTQAVPIAMASQSLGAALNELSALTGTPIAFPPALVAGKTAPAVRGTLTVMQALEQLLAHSGLGATRNGATVIIQARPADASDAALPPVKVSATSVRDGTTEGTGSYTARAASLSTGLNLSVRDTPQSVSVVTRQQIEDQNLRTLGEVMLQTPGIAVNKRDERLDLSSRGFGLSVMLDGAPTLSYSSTAAELGALGTAVYDRVEVLRGAAGLLNGAGTPGGAINLVRKRPTAEFAGRFTVGAGNWDRYQLEADVGGPLDQSGALRGRVVVSHSDGNTFIDQRSRREDIVYAVVEADLSSAALLTLGTEYQKTAIDGASFCTTPMYLGDGSQARLPRSFNCSTPWTYWNMTTQRTFARLDLKLGGGWDVRAELAHAQDDRAIASGALWSDPPLNAAGDALFALTRVQTRGRDTSFDVHAKGPYQWLGRTHEAVIGFNVSDYDYRDKGYMGDQNAAFGDRLVNGNINDLSAIAQPSLNQLYALLGGETRQYGAYASTRIKPTDRLSLIVGGRLSWYDSESWYRYWIFNMNGVKVTTPSEERKVFTPYAGAVFDIDEQYAVYVSYTDIFQANTVRDQAGMVLPPKVGRNREIGLKGEHWGGRLNTSVAVFETLLDNEPVADGTQPSGATAYRGARGAKTRGFELLASGEPVRNANVQAGYTYSQSKAADGTDLFTQNPKKIFRVTGTYRLPEPLHKLTVGGNLNYQSSIYRDESNGLGRMKLGGTTLLGLMARHEISPHLSASLNIDNLTDKVYQSGFLSSGFQYGAPRSVWLRLNYKM